MEHPHKREDLESGERQSQVAGRLSAGHSDGLRSLDLGAVAGLLAMHFDVQEGLPVHL